MIISLKLVESNYDDDTNSFMFLNNEFSLVLYTRKKRVKLYVADLLSLSFEALTT